MMESKIDPSTGETVIQYLDRTYSALLLDRQSYDQHYRDLSAYIYPRSTRFFSTEKNRNGNQRNSKIINNTATLALRTLSAGMMSGDTSPSRPWFALRSHDPELGKVQAVKLWLDTVRSTMNEVFLKSNLYTTLPVVYEDLGCFGTSAFALMEDDEDTMRCYHFPIGSYVLSVGHRGNVNGCYRDFQMSVVQLVEKFGLENCSTNVKSLYATRQLTKQIDVRHAIDENPDPDPEKLESHNLPFRDVYYEKGGNEGCYLSYKGYHEFPIMAPRWRVVGEDTWGNSPAMETLGDVMQLQQMEKRKLQALDMLLDPPRSVPASLRNEYIGTMSGEKTFTAGGSTEKVEPNYVINPYLNHMDASIAQVEQRVKRGLFEDIFLMIADIGRSNVTATEIQARQQEKMMVMGPVLERLNDEMKDPIIRRTFGIMSRAGLLPPPPPELQGTPLVVEYVSIMAAALKLQGVVAVERLVGFVGSVGNTRPDALDKLNTDEVIDNYADMVGTAPKLINDTDTVKKIRDARAAAAAKEQMMQQAQQAAATAKTMADTSTTTPSMLQAMSGALQQAGPIAGGNQ